MSLDTKLISRLVDDPEAIAKVWEVGLREEAFEEPYVRFVYRFIVGYWLESEKKSAPTAFAVETEGTRHRARFQLDTDVEEEAWWLAEKLMERCTTNAVQEMTRQAASTCNKDPIGTLDRLLESGAEAKRRIGKAGAEDTSTYIDVEALLSGELPEAPAPALMTRTDGEQLFYKREVNIVFGDPEHGKTWVMLAACAEELGRGGRVLVMDLDHNGAAAILSRLLLLGVPGEVLSDRDRFRLCEPTDTAEVMRVITDSQEWLPDAVVLDSTGELLPMFGASSDSADDFTKVHNQVLEPLAETGAAVLLADHLAKNRESRAMGPGGSMAKRRTVGGLSLRVVRMRPFIKGQGGAARLWVNKDRHGGVRASCPPPSPGKEEQSAGTFLLAPSGAWQVTPEPPAGASEDFRPTRLMERVSRAAEEQPATLTKTGLAAAAKGKKDAALKAVDVLESEKYLKQQIVPGQKAPVYISVTPYREADDPKSDRGDFARLLRQHLPSRNQEEISVDHQEVSVG